MKRFSIVLLISVGIILFNACAANNDSQSAAGFSQLTVTGDVANELELSSFGDYSTQRITYDENKVTAIELSAVLADAEPQGVGISIVLSAPDGVMAKIPYSDIDEECLLLLTADKGWVFYSPKHPPQAGIKNIDEIVICAEEPEVMQKCVRMINGQDELTLTYGDMYLADSLVFSVLEGQAQKNEASTDAYSRRELIPLSDYMVELGASEEQTALAYFGNGSQQQIELVGYLEWRGNSVDYIAADQKTREPDLIGIWIDAPKASLTDIADLALDEAAKSPVMIIELDGAGYYNLAFWQPEFLSSLNIQASRTVMPSISNVSLAAIISGELPSVNGITERNQRDLLVDDMFVAANTLGCKCAVIEGSSALVNMSIEQTLNPDSDGDGDTDNEVHAAALTAIQDGYDFIYVHYHGYDDVAHSYGPFSAEAGDKLKEEDVFVQELCKEFSGTVIITADHGQHETSEPEKPGNHGEFRALDMTVPIIIFEVK